MASRDWFRQQITAPRMLALYDQMLVSGVNFLTLVYLGRQLAPDAFGLFTLAYMSIIGLGTLHTALITQPLALIGAARPTIMNHGHLQALLRLHGVMWLPLNVLLLALVSWQFFPDPVLFAAASVYLCVFVLQELLRRYWYTCGEIHVALINDSISYGGQVLVILFWAAQPQFDAPAAFCAMSLTSLLALVHGWYRLRRQPSAFVPTREVIGAHWTTGAWLVLGTVSAYGATQIYPYMLAPLGAGAVAAFAASRNLLNALNVLVQASNNYLPIASKRILQHDGIPTLSSYLTRVGLGMFILAALFCVPMAYEAPDLLNWVYGKSFEGAGQLLPLLTLAAVASVIFPVINAGMLVLHQTPVIFIANIAGIVFNLSVGWWLIDRYGVNGAAIAASLSALLVLAIQAWRLKVALGGSTSNRLLNSKPCIS